MIVGTIGHIDHGKTALVKALTGTDTDRLKEEKARGMTIELGFAYWPQDNGSIIGFVDMPGHERLVHTMVAGAQGVDLVLLVIAADDGIMPQTREHIDIAGLLGHHQAIVALTKIDKIAVEQQQKLKDQINAFLQDTPLRDSPTIAVSALTGQGMDELAALLGQCNREIGARSISSRGFRLAVDRSFILQGSGLVVTGMALDGATQIGDAVKVSPSGLEARIRSIHAQNRPVQMARAGERCALNLVGAQIERNSVQRGDMIVSPELHAPSSRIDAQIVVAVGAKRGLTQWMPTRLLTGTNEVGAHIVLLSDESPQPGASCLIQIVSEKPIAVGSGDRFLLRDPSASYTLAGGVFIDIRAPERKRRSLERFASLRALALGDELQALTRWLETQTHPIAVGAFLRDRGVLTENARVLADKAGAVTFELQRELYALSPRHAAQWEEAVVACLARHHDVQPDDAGLGLERLRGQVARAIPSLVFRGFLATLLEKGVLAQERSWFRLPYHSLNLTTDDEAMWAQIEQALRGAARYRPPRVRDLAQQFGWPEVAARTLLRRLARHGRVHEVAQDHFFSASVLSVIATTMSDLSQNLPNGFSAADFRDRLETQPVEPIGRKVAIQLLEFFDRHGVTIRRGDLRRANPHRRDLFA